MNRILDLVFSSTKINSLPVDGSGQGGEGNEDHEEDIVKEKYELFRNISSKTVWETYRDLMKAEKLRKGQGNVNNNIGVVDCWQDADMQQKRVDFCIITVLLCMVSHKSQGGRWQKRLC